MLYKKVETIYNEMHEMNNIANNLQANAYKLVVNDILLKKEYGFKDDELSGLTWKNVENSNFEYGESLLKYVDSKVTDFSDQELTKSQIKEALSEVKGKDAKEITAMYEHRKQTAADYVMEVALENAVSGLSNASKFLDKEAKQKLSTFAIKVEDSSSLRKTSA